MTSTLALAGLLTALNLGAAQAYSMDPLTRRAYAPVTRQAEAKPQAAVSAPVTSPSQSTGTEVPAIRREVVSFSGNYEPGTIVVSTSERRMYLVMDNGRAMRYGVGVGRPGFEWGGSVKISLKREWPDWTPPPEMLKRRPDLPRHMKGGPENPLGARAMYLGSSLYRIHGSNEPETIGQAVSSGCIRMLNKEVVELFEVTPVGTKVIVQ
jgi:lipoprotein-anchoring transpeptidase ErfK/SrfK